MNGSQDDEIDVSSLGNWHSLHFKDDNRGD